MRQTLKLFVTDLDGTVLIDEGQGGTRSTARCRAALQALEAKGVTVCLASGRMHESITHIAGSLGVGGPVISYNGAMLRSAEDEILLHHRLEAGLAAEIIDLCEDRDLTLNFYHESMLYARKQQPWWDLYHGRTSSPMQAVDSLTALKGKTPTKLLACSSREAILRLRDELTPKLQGRCTLMITGDEYLEFMPLQADKGHALADLAGRLGLVAGQVVAAGDGYNDIGMIDYAGLGIAISTGREALKARADVVVGPPELDGLAAYIESELL